MTTRDAETIREMERELERLRADVGGDVAREILEMFLEDSPPRLESLERAVETSDSSTAGREAHSLKGAAGNLGSRTLWSVCEGLEREVREGDWPAAHHDLVVLRGQLGAVLEHFGPLARGL